MENIGISSENRKISSIMMRSLEMTVDYELSRIITYLVLKKKESDHHAKNCIIVV